MSYTLKTIVIGTSLSDTSDDIVRKGVRVAQLSGARAWLVCVQPVPAYPVEMLRKDEDWAEEYSEPLRAKIAQQAQRTGLADLSGFAPAQLVAAMGSTPEEIVSLARRLRADLVVVGASEGNIASRAFFGSTADGVIRKAPCPVLVLRPESAFPPVHVEIPVDLSAISASALRQGMNFLHQICAELAEKEVLFVLNPMEVMGSLQFTPDQIETFAQEELRRFLRANGASAGLARVRVGYPSQEILAALAEKRTDLAILGTHGRRGFERLMLGSVALAVMHQAACNVLIIPTGQGPREVLAEERVMEGADWSFVSDEASTVVTDPS